MSEELEIIKLSITGLITLTAVYLTYTFTKKQKGNEILDEKHRKVRTVISNLLLIWKELTVIEYYNKSNESYSNLLFTNSDLLSAFFKIDTQKISHFKSLMDNSKEDLKAINVKLFYQLHYTSQEVNTIFDILEMKITPEEKDFQTKLKDLLSEYIRALELIISETSRDLPRKEQNEITDILKSHQEDLNKIDIGFEFPKFLLPLIKKQLPFISDITAEELDIFYNDSTVKMVISKIFPFIGQVLIKENTIKTLRVFYSLEDESSEIGKRMEEFIQKVQITDFENELFKNNYAFYKLVCAIYKKFDNEIPFEFRRSILKINNGTVSLKEELEKHQNQNKADA